MAAAFSRWFVVMKERVVIWYPKTTRECFMYGLRWGHRFIGVVLRGEEIDPRQEVYYERVRNLTEVLERGDNMTVAVTGSSGHPEKSDNAEDSRSLTTG